MIIMDFKGITWVGNVYQKFEAMCLEVEEVMYQDTVKFVENQAQTVGASVKKFYSDVMQDFLPPSSIDPVKVAAADLSLNPYADFGSYKKPKASIKKDTIKVDKQDAEDSKVLVGGNTYYSSSFRGVHNVDNFQPPCSMGLVRGTGLELCLEQNEHRGLYKRKSRRDNNLQSEMSRPVTSMPKDLSRVSSCCELSENLEVACDQIAMISTPAVVDVTGCNPSGAKTCKNIAVVVSAADTSTDNPTPNMISPVESVANKEAKLICTSSNSGPDVLAAELNGTCQNSQVDSLIASYISGDPQYSESASENCLCPTGISGDCNLDANENDDDMIQLRMETITEHFEESKLEETCVLVETEKFCPVTHRKDKPRSYKKKIQKALSSKRSARKQEYKQLALQHGDMDAGSDLESAESSMIALNMDADTKKSPPPHDVCESEWELL